MTAASPEGLDEGVREVRASLLADEANAVDPERRPSPEIRTAWTAGMDAALDAVLPVLTAERERADRLAQVLREERDVVADIAPKPDLPDELANRLLGVQIRLTAALSRAAIEEGDRG